MIRQADAHAPRPQESGTPGVGEAPSPNARVPDFFVVGHPKSGTTALYAMLRRHPQIFMPDGKEPWFFAEELKHRAPPRPEGIPQTLEEYLALFAGAGAGQRIGEASPLYLWSHTAAARIAAVCPQARIIAILREPVSFLRSLHLQFVENYVETENDFGRAIALEEDRRRGDHVPRHSYWPQALLYSDYIHYVEQLRRYEAEFPPEQVLVLVYEDFRRDNEATVRTVMRFLGVDDTLPIAAIEANPTVHVRSQRLHHLLHAVSVGRGPASLAVKAMLKALIPRRWRRRALAAAKERVVYGSPRAADERLTLELRRRFKPEVVALGEHLGRDLSALWGYDELS